MIWGISWVNVQLMQDDSARVVDNNPDDPDNPTGGKIERRELKTKEDIINCVKGIM